MLLAIHHTMVLEDVPVPRNTLHGTISLDPRDAGIVSRGEMITGMGSVVIPEKVERKGDCIRRESLGFQ